MLLGALAELRGRQSRPARDRCRPGHHGRGARRHPRRISRRCARAAVPCIRSRCRRSAGTAASSRRRSSRSTTSPSWTARCSARCCTCCATGATTLDALVDAINATGYALTFGVHSRIDETIARLADARRGRQHLCQPQSDRRGGRRAAVRRPCAVRHRAEGGRTADPAPPARRARRRRRRWRRRRRPARHRRRRAPGSTSCGPTRRPRRCATAKRAIEHSAVGASAGTARPGRRAQCLCAGAARARAVPRRHDGRPWWRRSARRWPTGNVALVLPPPDPNDFLTRLPPPCARGCSGSDDPRECAVRRGAVRRRCRRACCTGSACSPICRGRWCRSSRCRAARRWTAAPDYDLAWLVHERAVSTNTAAAGGNASLMSIG